jgi:hypothetical protein
MALRSIGLAILMVFMGAVRQGRRSGNVAGVVTAAVVAAFAMIVAYGLLIVGLVMIEPRTIGRGTDGSGLPCPFG